MHWDLGEMASNRRLCFEWKFGEELHSRWLYFLYVVPKVASEIPATET